ncbi:conserved hypothetical protein, membrane [Candidatus Magnetomorum sp. HK-1]|nr:conserved hypothetical protein, membrane [Candidatus Magnetomorum sp. HK-1]
MVVNEEIKKEIWSSIIISCCLLIFFHEIFISNKSFLLRDLFCDFFRWRLFAKDALLSFNLPLWNPYSNMGQPFMANPQSAVFYPFHCLFLILDPVWAMKLSLIFHFLLSGLFMYALARKLSMTQIPALFVTITWMFNTHMVVQLEFHSTLTCLTWMPLAVLQAVKITDIVLKQQSQRILNIISLIFKDLVILILTLSIQFLAGNPQPLLFTIAIVSSYMFFPGIIQKNIRLIYIQFLALCIVGLFSLCLVFPQLLLTWELIPFSIRAHEIDPGLASGSVHPLHFLTVFLPFFWGGPGYFNEWLGKDWSLIEYWLGACYIGIPGLILITFSLSYNHIKQAGSIKTSKPLNKIIFFWIMGILGILITLGHHTPFYMFFYHLVPLFDRLRWPGNALCIPVFCFSILSGYGFQTLIQTRKKFDFDLNARIRRIKYIWFMILLIAFLLYINSGESQLLSYWTDCFGANKILTNQRISDMGFFILFLSLSLVLILMVQYSQTKTIAAWFIIILLFFNLYNVSKKVINFADDNIYRYIPQKTIQSLKDEPEQYRIHTTYGTTQQCLYGMNDPKKFQWAMDASVGDTCLPLKQRRTRGGGSLRLTSVTKIQSLLEKLPPNQLNKLADIMSIGYVIHGPPLSEIIKSKTHIKMNLSKRPTALPRSFFVSNWKQVDNWQSALTILLSPEFNPKNQVLIENKGSKHINYPQKKANVNRVIKIQDNWNQTDIKINAPDFGLLVLNDPWYPGWRVWVDNKEQSIFPVNGIFRGVFVQAGSKQVRFEYSPNYLKWAFGVTILAAIFMGACGSLGPNFLSLAFPGFDVKGTDARGLNTLF